MFSAHIHRVVGLVVTSECLWAATPVFAWHEMGTYENPEVDDSTIYNSVIGWDNIYDEEGCSHYGHSYLADISGPSGHNWTYGSTWPTVTSVPLAEGTFNMSGSISVDCGCGGNPSGGSSQYYSVEFFNAPYQRTEILEPGVSARYSRCNSGRCGTLDLRTTLAFVSARVTHVYTGQFPNDLTLQCYSTSYEGIGSCP